MPLTFILTLVLSLTALAARPLAAQDATRPPAPVTPISVVAAAPPSAWKAIAAEDMLVMTLAGDRRVVIQLAPRFSQQHVANIRTLAKALWWDGTSVYRVQDNYVVQWGDRTEKKPLPAGIAATLPEDYTIPYADNLGISELPSRDSYAHMAGFLDGWPVASDHDKIWLTHCYGMIGVGRNLSPDAGNGAELYAVIGHAPRQLDRNIALVGRVIAGMENLSSLTRGKGELGFYAGDQTPTPILSVRLASAMPPAEQPRFEMMDTASPSFADYAHVRANRQDDFYTLPAGGVDVCNVPVPVRSIP